MGFTQFLRSYRKMMPLKGMRCSFIPLKEFRGDRYEQDLHNRHARKDHCVANGSLIRQRQFIRVRKDRRFSAGACYDPMSSPASQ